MLMAMKSGHMSYLQVHPNTIRGTIKFLDSVQMDSGAYYGYTSPAKRPSTTSIGLLCRMYLGWNQDHQALMDGVVPGRDGSLEDGHVLQLLRHAGHAPDRGLLLGGLEQEMRDYLINTQVKEGPAKGSWYFRGGHGAERGGRLYNTSLATMILEVYYRHMPIYQKQATTEDFPL
jgi:hypothetical protein